MAEYGEHQKERVSNDSCCIHLFVFIANDVGVGFIISALAQGA
jgi:hypothetical protein